MVKGLFKNIQRGFILYLCVFVEGRATSTNNVIYKTGNEILEGLELEARKSEDEALINDKIVDCLKIKGQNVELIAKNLGLNRERRKKCRKTEAEYIREKKAGTTPIPFTNLNRRQKQRDNERMQERQTLNNKKNNVKNKDEKIIRYRKPKAVTSQVKVIKASNHFNESRRASIEISKVNKILIRCINTKTEIEDAISLNSQNRNRRASQRALSKQLILDKPMPDSVVKKLEKERKQRIKQRENETQDIILNLKYRWDKKYCYSPNDESESTTYIQRVDEQYPRLISRLLKANGDEDIIIGENMENMRRVAEWRKKQPSTTKNIIQGVTNIASKIKQKTTNTYNNIFGVAEDSFVAGATFSIISLMTINTPLQTSDNQLITLLYLGGKIVKVIALSSVGAIVSFKGNKDLRKDGKLKFQVLPFKDTKESWLLRYLPIFPRAKVVILYGVTASMMLLKIYTIVSNIYITDGYYGEARIYIPNRTSFGWYK